MPGERRRADPDVVLGLRRQCHDRDERGDHTMLALRVDGAAELAAQAAAGSDLGMKRDPFTSRRVASWTVRRREHRLYAKRFGTIVATAWMRLSPAQRELLR